jgi:hypothetical protein
MMKCYMCESTNVVTEHEGDEEITPIYSCDTCGAE